MNKVKDILNKINEQFIIQKSNIINEFLWSCAGINKQIIRQCPNDYAKYAGIGGTILFTALMASFSGGYAMFFVFKSIYISIAFAIFWGLLIFNLDRFIVNSMKIDDQSNKLTWNKIKLQLPRIIMALFLGIVISTPVEMRIFSDRIESQLLKDNIEHINSAKNASQDFTQLQELQDKQTLLLSERKKLNDELLIAQKELKNEAEGNALSGRAGHGTIYKDKEKYVNECDNALKNWDKNNQKQLEYITQRITSLNNTLTHFEQNVDNLQEDGFIARYEAFSNLKQSNNILNIMSWMITMLFIIIEIIPTFFKLVMPTCMYTELCEQYDELLKNAYKAQNEELTLMLKEIPIKIAEQKYIDTIKQELLNIISTNQQQTNKQIINITEILQLLKNRGIN